MAAIACETKVKANLRRRATDELRPIIEYVLTHPYEVTVTAVGGLFHTFMKACRGRSLSDDDNELFRKLEALFKARNDLAHRGVRRTTDRAVELVRAADATFTWLDVA